MIPEPTHDDMECDLKLWYMLFSDQTKKLIPPMYITKTAIIRAIYAERKLAEIQQDQITRSGYEDLHE